MAGRELTDLLRHPRESVAVLQRRARLSRFRRGRIRRSDTKSESRHFERVVRDALIGKVRGSDYLAWMSPFVELVVAWHRGDLDHADASARALQLLGKRIPSVVSWQDLSELSRQLMRVGLFYASLESVKASWSRLEVDWSSGRRDTFTALARVRGFIYQGKPQAARLAIDSMLDGRVPAHAQATLFELDWLTQLIPTHPFADRSGESVGCRSDWTESVRNQPVVVYGPGNATQLPELPNEFLVARIMGPGVFTWDSPEDLVSNRTDIVYSISANIEKGLRETGESFRQAILGYKFLCIKRGETYELPNARTVRGFGGLFMSGHPQMVPLSILDIQWSGAAPVVVGGDFFTSEVAYRESDRRMVGWSDQSQPLRPQSPSGSDGGDFDRCSLMASHNIFENWSLIKFLHDSGYVRGDAGFESAMDYSFAGLALRYDEILGSQRL